MSALHKFIGPSGRLTVLMIYGLTALLAARGSAPGSVADQAPLATVCVANADELRAALANAAANGQDDEIDLVQGTYEGNFTYDSSETHSLAIRGGYQAGCGSRDLDPANTIVDGAQTDRVLMLRATQNGASFEVEGITLQNGYPSGTQEDGGGLYVPKTAIASSLVVRNTRFLNNQASRQGGGAYASGALAVTIDKSVFEGNAATAFDGGGLFYDTSWTGAMLTVTDSSFTGNSANQAGGGAYLACGTCSTTSISGNTLLDNVASSGGGIRFSNGSSAGPVTIANNLFQGNNLGGADLSFSGPATLSGNVFLSNSGGFGGGIHVKPARQALLIENSTFLDNTASALGGAMGLEQLYGPVTVRNNLVAGNEAKSNCGGGLYANISNSLDVVNNTITGNSSQLRHGGGGMYITMSTDSSTADLYNNIVWHNTSVQGGADLALNNRTTTPVTLRYNDFDQSSNGIWMNVAIPIEANNLDNEDPLFVNLSANDFHLQDSSPVIDRGSDDAPGIPPTDLDGNPRIYGPAVDMGAYEWWSADMPDLTVTHLTGDTMVLLGGIVRVSAKVKNQGIADSGSFRVGFYLSADPVIDTSDTFTGSYCEMANLTPGEEQPCQKAVRIQGVMPGLYYLGAIADYQGVVDETDEGNNTLASQSGVLQVFQGRCLLDVNAIYSGGNLTPDVKLSNLDPMRWSMTLVTSGGVNTILNRDLLVVPYVLPISFPIPLPPQGKVAVVSTLATAGGTQCFDFAVADTGGGSAVSVDQLKQAARQAGYPVP